MTPGIWALKPKQQGPAFLWGVLLERREEEGFHGTRPRKKDGGVKGSGKANFLELYLKRQKDSIVPALLMALCLEQYPDNAGFSEHMPSD